MSFLRMLASSGVKRYLYGGLALLLISGLAFSHSWMYRAGVNAEAKASLAVMNQYQTELMKLSEELADEKAKIKIEYRNKIRIVREAEDPTACSDTPIPSDILYQLGDGKDRPRADSEL